jgi:peptide/nickel transport system permease protein
MIVFGIFFGVSSAKKPYSIRSNAITAVSLAGYSLPEFLIGQVLIVLFAITLGLFPTGGMYSVRGEFNPIVDVLWHLALPAVSLAFGGLAIISRLTRASMLESLHQDYIVTARAKGLSERSVLYRHAFRNAMLPVITVISLRLSALLAGDLLIEVVFSWPGLGRLLFDAMAKRDFPVVQGMFFLISITVVTVTLFTDIIYARLDPRIRYSK